MMVLFHSSGTAYLTPHCEHDVVEAFKDGRVLCAAKLQQRARDVSSPDDVHQFAHCFIHSSIKGSAASGACSGIYPMGSMTEWSYIGEFAFKSTSNHSCHCRRVACLSRNKSPVALLI